MLPFGKNKTTGGANPLDIAEYRNHLRLDGTDHDADLAAKMAEALAYCEAQTARQFTLATWELEFKEFPPGSRPQLLPFGNLVSVDEIAYYDTGGTLQTINSATIATDYIVQTTTEPGRIMPVPNAVWPETRRQPNAVKYTIQCGKAAAAVDPQALSLLKYITAHLFRNREPGQQGQLLDIPHAAAALIQALRFDAFVRYDPHEAPKL